MENVLHSGYQTRLSTHFHQRRFTPARRRVGVQTRLISSGRLEACQRLLTGEGVWSGVSSRAATRLRLGLLTCSRNVAMSLDATGHTEESLKYKNQEVAETVLVKSKTHLQLKPLQAEAGDW